jgi:hypothetical protein
LISDNAPSGRALGSLLFKENILSAILKMLPAGNGLKDLDQSAIF